MGVPPPPPLPRRELWSVRVETMEMMRWWRNMFFSFLVMQLLEKLKENWMSKTFNVIINNKSQTVFHGLYILLLTIEMTSKCSKPQWNHMLMTCDSTSIVSLYVTLTKTRPGPGGWGGVMDANILDSYFLKYQYAKLLYMHTPNFWPALINKSVQPFFSLLWLEKSPL